VAARRSGVRDVRNDGCPRQSIIVCFIIKLLTNPGNLRVHQAMTKAMTPPQSREWRLGYQ
jgi:hypothetical protein